KIGRSKLSGKGVFAIKSYEAGGVVEVCPYITMNEDDVQGVLLDYIFEGFKDGTALCVLGYGMIYNHSDSPNLEPYQGDGNTIEFVALRKIKKGEELTHDYGNDWWGERSKHPK
ncbi:SET domain-containing protein-lysine N-methyltransferase, partial [Nitrospinae bacterium AH_259_B05_G02_I21]|nr:SET domain-containing protein-lysine N-methyltransferase [Nitrospinae bacterium AH_259_B05_G02_I21]